MYDSVCRHHLALIPCRRVRLYAELIEVKVHNRCVKEEQAREQSNEAEDTEPDASENEDGDASEDDSDYEPPNESSSDSFDTVPGGCRKQKAAVQGPTGNEESKGSAEALVQQVMQQFAQKCSLGLTSSGEVCTWTHRLRARAMKPKRGIKLTLGRNHRTLDLVARRTRWIRPNPRSLQKFKADYLLMLLPSMPHLVPAVAALLLRRHLALARPKHPKRQSERPKIQQRSSTMPQPIFEMRVSMPNLHLLTIDILYHPGHGEVRSKQSVVLGVCGIGPDEPATWFISLSILRETKLASWHHGVLVEFSI